MTKVQYKMQNAEDDVLKASVDVLDLILSKTLSRKFSIKLRTLLRYGFVSYIARTKDLNVIRGLAARILPPPSFTHQYFYLKLQKKLKERFGSALTFEKRRNHTYVVVWRD